MRHPVPHIHVHSHAGTCTYRARAVPSPSTQCRPQRGTQELAAISDHAELPVHRLFWLTIKNLEKVIEREIQWVQKREHISLGLALKKPEDLTMDQLFTELFYLGRPEDPKMHPLHTIHSYFVRLHVVVTVEAPMQLEEQKIIKIRCKCLYGNWNILKKDKQTKKGKESQAP